MKRKNCDLDFSVEKFQSLFRKIQITQIINEGNIDGHEYSIVHEGNKVSWGQYCDLVCIACCDFNLSHAHISRWGITILYIVCVCSGGPRTDQPSGEVTATTTAGPDRKWAPTDSGSVESRTGPNVGIVPDNQQLFVGNLPHSIDDEELVKFFTSESVFDFPQMCASQKTCA